MKHPLRTLLLTTPLFTLSLAGDWLLTFSNPSLKPNEQTKPLPNPHYSWSLTLPGSVPVAIRRSTAITPVDGGTTPQVLSLKTTTTAANPLTISTVENCDFDLLSFIAEIPPKNANSTEASGSGFQRFLEITVTASTGQKQSTVIVPEEYDNNSGGMGDVVVGDATLGARRVMVRVGGYEMGSLMIGWKRMDWVKIEGRFVTPGTEFGSYKDVAGLTEEQKEWGLGELALRKRCGV